MNTTLSPNNKMQELESECQLLQLEFNSLRAGAATPQSVVKQHIAELKRFNRVKDIALGLITLIADSRGITVKEVMDEMGLDIKL